MARLKEKGRLIDLNDQFFNFNNNIVLEIPGKKQLNPNDKMIHNEVKHTSWRMPLIN